MNLNLLSSITSLEWWKPQDYRELLLFVIILIVLIIWVMLIHYSVVNSSIKQTSRCLREQMKFSSGASFNVNAYDAYNKPLYSANYDFFNKKYSTRCDCEPGNHVNKFNIKLYDLRTQKKSNIDKICSCNQDFNANNDLDVYYKGYPGLVSFMENDDTSFFANQLTASS